jgi:uncharacterized membrane protein
MSATPSAAAHHATAGAYRSTSAQIRARMRANGAWTMSAGGAGDEICVISSDMVLLLGRKGEREYMTSYNRIAGQSIERLAALSDGIFAVAMTLLVLDLRVPAQAIVHSDGDLAQALMGMAPQLVTYLMSFLTLGIFWVGQQTQLNYLERGDRSLVWAHLGFLFAVSLMPFSTRLLGDFPSYRLALVLYWVNLLLLGAALYVSWMCAQNLALTKADTPPEIVHAVRRRIVVYQSLYALGALLCVLGTYWSIGFIVLVQLSAVITAPRR